MKNSLLKMLLIGFTALLAGCATSASPNPKPNALQLQAMETRVFQVDKKGAFQAVMTVLQNQGDTINATNFEVGLISASSPTHDKSITAPIDQTDKKTNKLAVAAAAVLAVGVVATGVAVASHDHHSGESGHTSTDMSVGYGSDEYSDRPDIINYQTHISVTIMQEQSSKGTKPTTRIRLNFVETQFHNHHAGDQKQIICSAPYQKMFNAIRQQIFIGQSA